MNHSFSGNSLESCTKCGFNEIAHSETAQCESCTNIGPCEIIDGMLMCADCQARDKQIKAEIGEVTPEMNPKEAKVAELINRLAKEIPIDRRMYFVGRITAIVDIEAELIASGIENPRYKLAEIVENNLDTLKARLTAKHAEIREMQGAAVADQKYLNQIVPQLRKEEREKFKQYDINYKPSVAIAAPSANKPRMSASDKAMESFAKLMGITPEQARINMANAVKNVTGNVCSCKETPGMCKVHPK